MLSLLARAKFIASGKVNLADEGSVCAKADLNKISISASNKGFLFTVMFN